MFRTENSHDGPQSLLFLQTGPVQDMTPDSPCHPLFYDCMVHSLFYKISHKSNGICNAAFELVNCHNSFASTVKSGKNRTLNLGLFSVIVIPKKKGSVFQCSILIIKTCRTKSLFRKYLSVIMERIKIKEFFIIICIVYLG